MPNYDAIASIYIASEGSLEWAAKVTHKPIEEIRKLLEEANNEGVTCVITESYAGEFDRTIPPPAFDFKLYP